MITSVVFIALIGTFQFKATISAAISYEPIKITVNENFNAQPGQVSTEFKSLEPGVVHQGANFYFKPRFNLPSSSISHHIEALMSLIQHHSCAKDATKVVFEKDKLMEILMPFLNPNESLLDTVMEEENSSEIVKPVSILITEERKQATPELLVIPEAPVLPPISFNSLSPIVEKEIKNEESVTLEESTGVLNEPTVIEVEPKPTTIELEVIPEGPVLSPFSNDIRIVEEVKIEEPPMPQPTLVDIEAKPVITELLFMPEAPVLPALSFNGMSSMVEQEVKKEESVILEESTDIFPTMPAITVGPITEPILTYVEPKSSTSGLLVIPEAPVLPSLSFNGMPSFVEKEVIKEKSIVLKESIGESQEPTIIEVEPKPTTPELVLIPEAPVLSPLSANDIHIVEEMKIGEPVSLPKLESIVVDIEPKSVTQELFVIPETPILPPLSVNGIPAFVEEEVKKEESVILEESTGVLQEPTIIEVVPRPATPEFVIIPGVLHSLSFEDIHDFVEEEIKNKESIILEGSTGESQEPIIIEPKPGTPELEIIPETPVLPPLSFNGIPDFVEEEVKKKESVLLEESTGLFPEPTIIEVEPENTTPQLLVIPEAPVLPPLSLNDMSQFIEKELKKEESIIPEESQEPNIIEIKSKPATTELVIIPEAPVLRPFSANDIRIVEEVKIDKPITLPMPESIVVDIEPKPATTELLVIPEAPMLPPLSFNGFPSVVESTGVLNEPTVIEVEPKPTTIELEVIPEGPVLSPFSNDIRIVEEVKIEEPPMPQPTLVDIEAKPVITELLFMPEAPVLPALSFNGMSSMVEQEVKKEESVILEESTDIFPTMPAITVGPITEPILTYVEPKSSTSGLLVIPEAPVLPSLSFNGMPSFVEKEVIKEKSIVLKESIGESQEPTIIEVEPKPTTPELVLIPEAPVLSPLSANDIHIVEEMKIGEPVSLPKLESIVVDIEPKSVTQELFVIPETPILPPLSVNGIPAFVEEEVKKEESVILEESTGVLQEPTIIEVVPRPATPEFVIIPGVLHSLSFEDIHDFVEEEIKNKESIILEGSTGESQEPIIIEPKPGTPELEIIPETPVLPPLSFNGIPDFVEEEVKKKESVLLEESTGLFPEPTIIEVEPENTTPQLLVIPEAPVLPPLSLNDMSQFIEKELKKEESIIPEESQEPNIIEIKSKPATTELVIIPEAPVLRPFSANDIRIVEEVKIDKPITLPMPESIVVDIEPKPATTELLVIPEAPMLPPLSFNGFPSVVEAEVEKEESVILEESTGTLQEPTIIEVEPRPTTPELLVIAEAPVLPPISEMAVDEEINSDESILLEESTGSIPEISARPILESFVETETAESFALENNIFPVTTDEIKIEIPILLEESIEVFPPIAEISSEPTLQEPEITNSSVLEEVSQSNSDRVAAVKETLTPTIVRKPSINLGVFSYAPFLSHLSNRAPKEKKRMFPKPASLEHFLLKKHPFRLPVTPYPKLFLNDMKSPILGNKNQFIYPTPYAHDVVDKRISPNMAFKNNAPPKSVKFYVRSYVPIGQSYL